MAALAAGYQFLLDAAARVDSVAATGTTGRRPAMRAALYARVSTERQADRGTIGSQLQLLREHIAAAGDELVGEYVDDGHSGARLDRPGLDALRDAAEAGLIERVWCLSPDRLARAYAYQVLVLDELDRFGVTVAFTDSPGLAADDPQAVLLTQVQGVIAEYEKAKIAERYRRGKLFRARAGEIVTWKASYGYRRIARSAATGQAHHEIYEPEAAVVRRIFTDRAAGITVREICRRLNADAIPSPTGKPTWGTSTLCRLLRNEAYIGRVYYNRTESVPDRRPTRHHRQVPRDRDEWIPIDCPRIISDELFQAAGRVATDNTKWSPRRAEPGQWLLKGLVKCGVCGVGTNCHKMRGRNGTWHRYYHCRNHDPIRAGGESRRCPERNIRADALDAFVFDHIRTAITRPDLLLAGEQAVTLHNPDPRRRTPRRRTGPAGPQDRRRRHRTAPPHRPLPGRVHRTARNAAPRHRDRRTPKRAAAQANQPRRRTRRPSPATISSDPACTTSPPASTPSSTPSMTPRNSSCCACSSKTSASPAGTSRSGCASHSTRHHPNHPTRPAQQAQRQTITTAPGVNPRRFAFRWWPSKATPTASKTATSGESRDRQPKNEHQGGQFSTVGKGSIFGRR